MPETKKDTFPLHKRKSEYRCLLALAQCLNNVKANISVGLLPVPHGHTMAATAAAVLSIQGRRKGEIQEEQHVSLSRKLCQMAFLGYKKGWEQRNFVSEPV